MSAKKMSIIFKMKILKKKTNLTTQKCAIFIQQINNILQDESLCTINIYVLFIKAEWQLSVTGGFRLRKHEEKFLLWERIRTGGREATQYNTERNS